MVTLKDFLKICNNVFDTIFIFYLDIDENYSSKEYRQEKEVLEKYGDAFICEFMVNTETHTLVLDLIEEDKYQLKSNRSKKREK